MQLKVRVPFILKHIYTGLWKPVVEEDISAPQHHSCALQCPCQSPRMQVQMGFDVQEQTGVMVRGTCT